MQAAHYPRIALCSLGLVLPGCFRDATVEGASDGASTGISATAEASGSTASAGGGSAGSAGTEGGTSGTGTTAEGSTAASGDTDTATGTTTGDPDPLWEDFVAERENYLHALAVPIAACIAKADTQHPAFHGCIDWHSAVHASYSLLALFRLTGDSAYLDAVDAALDPKSLTAELLDVEGGALPQELPYGYAWFLTLAREREEASGDLDLVPLAAAIAADLRAWLAARSPEELVAGGLSDDYGNVSWAALNLYLWAVHAGDDGLEAEVVEFAQEVLLDPAFDAMCPLSQEETDADDFFPPCLQRAYALTVILPEASEPWLAAYLPESLTLTPIQSPTTAHIAGLNFSRAWGLWALYQATGDTQWRSLYVEHVVAHMEQPAYWAEDYYKHSHWVAQFGVYAIALSYGD